MKFCEQCREEMVRNWKISDKQWRKRRFCSQECVKKWRVTGGRVATSRFREEETECIRGHDLTKPENVYRRPNGWSYCRICARTGPHIREPKQAPLFPPAPPTPGQATPEERVILGIVFCPVCKVDTLPLEALGGICAWCDTPLLSEPEDEPKRPPRRCTGCFVPVDEWTEGCELCKDRHRARRKTELRRAA
jgi:hypothetical protein